MRSLLKPIFIFSFLIAAALLISPHKVSAVDGTCSGQIPNCTCTCPSGYEPAGDCQTECTAVYGTFTYTGTCSCEKVDTAIPSPTCQEQCLASGETPSICNSLPSCSEPLESGSVETEAGNGTVTINPPKGQKEVETPLGTIPTDPAGFAKWFLRIGIGLGTLFAVIFLIIGGFGVVTSSGDPEKLQKAKDQITAAVSGLVFLLISTIILHIIGIEIIGISPEILPF